MKKVITVLRKESIQIHKDTASMRKQIMAKIATVDIVLPTVLLCVFCFGYWIFTWIYHLDIYRFYIINNDMKQHFSSLKMWILAKRNKNNLTADFTFVNNPLPWGTILSAETLSPPMEFPPTVMSSGSPPKDSILSFTHLSAISWSHMPWLPGSSEWFPLRNPSQERR